jgi:hypothetical protein
MKVIFGSGIVGLLAKMILGPSWTVVPFYRSRFFSFNPSLDDNFIICDPQIDDIVKELTKVIKPVKYEYKRAWSIGGHILPSWEETICNDWLYKIYGDKIPPQSLAYNKDRMSFSVYDLRINELYANLTNMFIDELKEQSSQGQVTAIGDHYFVRNGIRHDFESAVNTVPLNHIAKLCNLQVNLASKDVHYWHVRTDDLNFEGFNQLLVADTLFGFYKVTNISPGRYMFYCHEDIPNPGTYLMGFMSNFEIIDGTSVQEALPAGSMPDLQIFDNLGIYNVGSYAQWDWCADVGSNMLKLVKFANRGNRPFKSSDIFK